MRFLVFALCIFTSVSFFAGKTSAVDSITSADRNFFETKIRPVLVEHCFECHATGADEVGANLLLDRPSQMIKGGESGAVIVPGKPHESLLIKALEYDDDELAMPPSEALPKQVVNDFAKWIKNGAKDPRIEKKTDAKATIDAPDINPQQHWSFYPRRNPTVPQVADPTWPQDPIDHFVLHKIESAGLNPARDAEPVALIRRVYYDLIGLPPTYDQTQAFEAAYAKDARRALADLVDDLLGRPAFGERWGRHWLDVARYGESNGDDGLGRNATFPHAWRYRDYVIESLNSDLPYDDFLKEQIAGDLLDSRTARERNRRLTATGFLAIGSKPAAAMNKNFAMDVVDDQINTVCTAVMGLSVACARCHDHKHDPIPTRDYYALAGIFSSTETLYGLAGQEKLTAPPTPLHELRPDWSPEKRTKHVLRQTPKLPPEYAQTIQALKPYLYEQLSGKTDSLEVGKDFKADKKNYAQVKNTKIHGQLPAKATDYSISFWFKNDIANKSRPITAYLFSRAKIGDKTLPGDHLGIGGTHDANRTGKLFVFNGNQKKQSVAGDTLVEPKTWNHVTLVRSGNQVGVFLNGRKEFQKELEVMFSDSVELSIGRRSDQFAPLQGNIGELVVFDRALSDEESFAIYDASGFPRSQPPVIFPLAMGTRDRAKPADTKIHINGDGAKKGASVPRGYLSVYQQVSGKPSQIIAQHKVDAKQSGRLQLAQWLTDPQHPQTARVMANRVWMHLIGNPIVETPDDFGVYGARPSHPELLDHLATRFVEDGWSIKTLIRNIVLSRTYALSNQAPDGLRAADPNNDLFGFHKLKRLDAESLRDSILFVTGDLDTRPGQGSAISELDQLINWPPGEATNLHQESYRRSVYLCMLRHDPPNDLAPFDLPAGVAIAGRRSETNLPTQSLYLMNSPFVISQAERYASTLLANNDQDEARVNRVFQAILGRNANRDQQKWALAHVRSISNTRSEQWTGSQTSVKAWSSLVQGLITTNEFRYVD